MKCMGEVYRARDTRLRCDVAIKTLLVENSADPERRQRFEREARAVAALSHPNICAIHDVGANEVPRRPPHLQAQVPMILTSTRLRRRPSNSP